MIFSFMVMSFLPGAALLFPPDEMAEIYCPQCGQYIHRESRYDDPAVHGPECPIHLRRKYGVTAPQGSCN